MGGGPSLKGLNVEALRGRKVIAVNSSFAAAPFADFLFFGDSRWWHLNSGAALKRIASRVVTNSPTVRDPRVLLMRKTRPPPGIVDERDSLAMQYTSMQAAMNLAVHLGAARLVLLGLDGQPAPDGATHHHPPHPWPQRSNCWDMQAGSLRTTVKPLLKRGIDVVNANPGSAYSWWRKEPFAECLARYA